MMKTATVFCAAAILLASATARAQSAPAPAVPVKLDGGPSIQPLVPDVDVDNKVNAQVPLDLEFTDSTGKTVRLRDLIHGERPVVLDLGYFQCPSLCDRVMNGLLEAMQNNSLALGDDYEVLSVSINHNEKTETARLKKANYAAAFGDKDAVNRGWHFLTTTSEKDIRTLTDAVGYGWQYIPAKDQYAHPAVLIVLTPDGRVMRYLFGVKYEPFTFEQSLIDASEGKAQTVWNKILMTCYVYDSTAGQYNWYAMGLMRLAGGVTVVLLGGAIGMMLFLNSHNHKTPGKDGEDAGQTER